MSMRVSSWRIVPSTSSGLSKQSDRMDGRICFRRAAISGGVFRPPLHRRSNSIRKLSTYSLPVLSRAGHPGR